MILDLNHVIDYESPIDKNWLHDPEHPITALVLYVWTMETDIYRRLNEVQRENDISFSPTLGPYAFLLTRVLGGYAMKNRTDIDISIFTNGVYVYRGMNLSWDQLKEYDNLNGTQTKKYLHGHTATSLDENEARGYAQNYGTSKDKENQRVAVLFKMFWDKDKHFHYMDMGAYPDEKELLLLDGRQFIVTDFKEECKECRIKDFGLVEI